MTEQEQQISISKACGWEWHHTQSGGCYVSPDKQDTVRRWQDLPDYLNDLNAIHQACMENLTGHQGMEFFWVLLRVMNQPENLAMSNAAQIAIHATARQRAEAFLKVKGKWKD